MLQLGTKFGWHVVWVDGPDIDWGLLGCMVGRPAASSPRLVAKMCLARFHTWRILAPAGCQPLLTHTVCTLCVHVVVSVCDEFAGTGDLCKLPRDGLAWRRGAAGGRLPPGGRAAPHVHLART